MENTRIQKALEAASETEAFISREGCLVDTAQIFQQYFSGARALVVADDITFSVAGKSVYEGLRSANVKTLEPFVFPGEPMLHADYVHIEKLRDFLQEHPNTIPIAVGSGTVNDIVKRTVYEADRRYMVVATAASVDGYSSFGASISRDGFKKTMDCLAPLAIMADIEILRNAPIEMTAAGYGDLMSKVPAGADWIIADLVGAEPIAPLAWDMIHPHLRSWLSSPEKLKTGDPQTFEALFEGLTMTGFAMQAIHKSRPASGADHLFSHIWDMKHHRDASGQRVSHGFQVSLGTLASTALMEIVFARDIQQLDIDNVCQQWKSWEEREVEIQQAFRGTPIVDRVIAESQAKYLSIDQLRDRLNFIVAEWETLRNKVNEQIIPYQKLKEMLLVADCPVRPEDVNLSKDQVRETYFLAQMIRNRYTILDLAYELNWLKDCVEEIIVSDKYL